jgi:Protein kinase domain
MDNSIVERYADQMAETIDQLTLKVGKLEAEIDEVKGKIETARGFFDVLESESYSDKLLREKLRDAKWLHEAMTCDQDKKENRKGLKDFIEKLEQKIERLEHRITDLSQERKEYRLALLKQSGQQADPVMTDLVLQGGESGVLYVRATYQVGYIALENFGLVVKGNNNRFHVRAPPHMEVAHFVELDDVWSLVRDPKAWSTSDQLVAKLPSLDATFVKNAWMACQYGFQLDPPKLAKMGEMAFQQSVYTSFSMLLMAAAGSSYSELYRADQTVTSSLSVLCKENEEDSFETTKISLKPDAAATLGHTWDAFAMMEIKKSQRRNNHSHLGDNVKCVLMTAVTAIILRRCLAMQSAEQFKDVALPFVIATGTECSLYVTMLTDKGNPCVKFVGYPDDDGNSGIIDCGTPPSEERKKMFLALAGLLNKFNKFFDSTKRKMYMDHVRYLQLVTEKLENGISSKWQASNSNSTCNTDDDQRGGSPNKKRSAETAAKEAAACGGMFRNVIYPFERFLHFTDTDVVIDQQKKSPFYFKCYLASSDNLTTGKEIFLKVWKVEDTDTKVVEAEVNCHRKAFDAGVPVAAPVLPKIARSKCADGSEYLVFAADYIHQDRIEDPWVLMEFCGALIDTVEKLHHQAGLLHCDLKPDNLRWSNGVVKLIDFGHAQSISEAISTPGTLGFEAPEILNGMPNSVKTDAFSVGRIILTWLKLFEDQGWEQESHQRQVCIVLHHVANALTDADPESRWSLSRAANELQDSSSKFNAIHKGANLKMRRLNDSSSPPSKMAKQSMESVAAH